MRKWKNVIAFAIVLVVSLFVTGSNIHAQTGVAKAQSLFIYNFSRLVEWPGAYKSGDFVIGVYGSSDVATELKNFTSGKKVGTQAIKVENYNSTSEISKCHILFVSFGKSGDMSSIKSTVGSGSTLIVSEKRGLIEQGAAINFVIVGDKLKFQLNTGNANGLTISSSLQNMALKE